MKRKIFYGIIIIILSIPLLILVSCSKKNSEGSGMNPVAMEGASPIIKTKTMYRSTMNPNEVSDKPGKDSMGMEMVPFEVGESTAPTVEGLAPVTISPEQQQLIGVKTTTVQYRDITRIIRTIGTVAYDPELYYAEQEYISSVKVYEEAQQSSQGLAVSNAKALLDASHQRLKLMGLSDVQIDNLARRGEPDKSLLKTAEGGAMWIYASVYQSDLEYVKSGQRARISSPSVLPSPINGKVVSISPVLDPATRAARARILTENTSGLLKPEVYVNVEIDVPLGNRITVPTEAILDTGTRKVVFVDKGNGVFEPREIKSFQTDGTTVVQSGLSVGEKVVTNANFLIDSESQLKAVTQKTAGGSAGGHHH